MIIYQFVSFFVDQICTHILACHCAYQKIIILLCGGTNRCRTFILRMVRPILHFSISQILKFTKQIKYFYLTLKIEMCIFYLPTLGYKTAKPRRLLLPVPLFPLSRLSTLNKLFMFIFIINYLHSSPGKLYCKLLYY